VWERLSKVWKNRGVEFVGIGLHSSKEKSRAFVDRHRLTFPNGFDGDGTIARAYGFRYQPYWAVISRDGLLLQSGFAPRGEDAFVQVLRTLTR
jgi:peroxiredoxin